MFKMASDSGPAPQTPLGDLTTLTMLPYRAGPIVVRGLLQFLAGSCNRSFAPSALNPHLTSPNKNPRPVSPHTQNPRTATGLRRFLFEIRKLFNSRS